MWNRPDLIKAEAFCSLCGERFDFTNLQVLDEKEGATILYIKCNRCQAGSLSSISLGQGKLNFITTVTDLFEEEVLQYHAQDPLEDDHVLELHAFLLRDDNFLDHF